MPGYSDQSSDNRIRVMRGNRLVPLLPGSGGSHARIAQPWRDIQLERHAVQPVEIPEHQHRELCVQLQLTGRSTLEWWSEGRNCVEQTAPGSIILLSPGTRDRVRWESTSDRLILTLQAPLLRRVAEEFGSRAQLDFLNQWSLFDPALEQALLHMAGEAEEGWPLGSLYADLLGMRLAALLLHRHAATPPVRTHATGGLSFATLRRVLEFMTDNLHRDLRLEEIAAEAGLNSFHLARQFRSTMKQSPYQYLLAQRIARAQGLLRNRTLSIQDIARETGWNSPVNFSRAFRQRTGLTPGAWRESV